MSVTTEKTEQQEQKDRINGKFFSERMSQRDDVGHGKTSSKPGETTPVESL
jgi:hypothetical protein